MTTKQDPYASEAETQALLVPDTRTDAERKLASMMAERGADEQGAEAYPILRQIVLELLTEQPAPVQQGWPSDCLVSEKAKQSGFDLSPTPNILYTVRGNHAQLVNFARAMLAAAPQSAQPQQEPLTDERVKGIAGEAAMWGEIWEKDFIQAAVALIRKTEAAHAARGHSALKRVSL